MPETNKYNGLLDNIGLTIEQARQNAIKIVKHRISKSKLGNWQAHSGI